MWTPRRILLIVVGITLFLGAYLGYTFLLGDIDGLPQLPEQYLVEASGDEIIVQRPISESTTYQRLRQAFGPNSLEINDQIAYKNQFEIRDRGFVISCGQPVTDGSPDVVVSPFSMAMFGSNSDPKKRPPGEIQEITTLHADRAVLTYDQPIDNPGELAKANLMKFELIGLPDMLSPDPRKGNIWLVNNRRSPKVEEHLVVKTPGPLYYVRPDEKESAQPLPTVEADARAPARPPQVYTYATVTVIDRENLPRVYSDKGLTASTRKDTQILTAHSSMHDLRRPGGILDILKGRQLPPPTIKAEGMKIYLSEKTKDTAQRADNKQNSTNFSGVKLIELSENVHVNLWTQGSSGLPGTTPKSSENPPTPTLSRAEMLAPPFPAAVGGLLTGTVISAEIEGTSLLTIETPGAFRYDFTARLARFESAAVAKPSIDNYVTVTRMRANAKQDDIACDDLVIAFYDPKELGDSTNEKMTIRRLNATGDYVYVSFEDEGLNARGTELEYVNHVADKRTTTRLAGAPVVAVRETNRLTSGSPNAPSQIRIETYFEGSGKDAKKVSSLNVDGPGEAVLQGEDAKKTSFEANWSESLSQTKVFVGKQEQELLTFKGRSSFSDPVGKMNIDANGLMLWLAREDPDPDGKLLPARLLGTGDVTSLSDTLQIGMEGEPPVDRLTINFRDIPPPPAPTTTALKPPSELAPPKVEVKPQPQAETVVAQAEPKPEPEPQPRFELSARIVDAWVTRYPETVPPINKEAKPTTKLKYALERAHCEDRVVVHQDPTDPKKNPDGLDIRGRSLNLDQTTAGKIMTVVGTGADWAQVHFEGISLLGPLVVIDQPNNSTTVNGQGMLRMPNQSGVGESSTPTRLVVQWNDSMLFEGALSRAKFIGLVHASQMPKNALIGPRRALVPKADGATKLLQAGAEQPPEVPKTWSRSNILCHELNVTFDRPIYFNEFRRDDENPKQDDAQPAGPKLQSATCIPIPNDEATEESMRQVVYLDETFSQLGRRLKAQRLVAEQIDLDLVEKQQIVIATGPGELRLLQPSSDNAFAQAAPSPSQAQGNEPMKLTMVKFDNRMQGRDAGAKYQEAIFYEGARVIQVPTADLDATIAEHAPPEGSMTLTCTDQLVVTSIQKITQEEPLKTITEQGMVAKGNAYFKNDDYDGTAATVTYRNDRIIFDGNERALARLYQRKSGVGEKRATSARQIIYHSDGRIETTGSVSGSISPR